MTTENIHPSSCDKILPNSYKEPIHDLSPTRGIHTTDKIQELYQNVLTPEINHESNDSPSLINRVRRVVIGILNGIQGAAETICLIVRITAVATIVLPIIHFYHFVTTWSSKTRLTDDKIEDFNPLKIAQNSHFSDDNPRDSIDFGLAELFSKPDNQVVDEFESLKLQSRENYQARLDYFSSYSANVDIFSFEKTNERLKGEADPKLVYASRESYINMNFVYYFDGAGMVERELTMLQQTENGKDIAVKYKVDKYFESPEGLISYGLIPIEPKDAPPRLIFRGTNPEVIYDESGKKINLPTGLKADLAKKIGKRAFEEKKTEMSEWLERVTSKGEKKAFVSGHSLGGVMAMRLAATFPGWVDEVYTINSPRLEVEACPDTLDKNMKITHVVMQEDIVPLVGGGTFSPGRLLSNQKTEVVLIPEGGHTCKNLSFYCMRAQKLIHEITTIEVYEARLSFYSRILDFIRPNYFTI